MLGDENRDVRKHAVSIIRAIRESSANPDHNLASKSDEIECVNVRRFEVPKTINSTAKFFFEMVNLDDSYIQQPPAFRELSSSELHRWLITL